MDTAQKFPNFKLPNQDGDLRTLDSYKGHWTAFYVYPKDDTPGCTLQGQSFTSRRAEFESLQTKVVGISEDSVESHKNFCNKFSFSIELLADTKASLLSQLGIGQKEFNGKKFWNRSTFLLDPQGVIRKIYENVRPEGHEQELLRDIKELQS